MILYSCLVCSQKKLAEGTDRSTRMAYQQVPGCLLFLARRSPGVQELPLHASYAAQGGGATFLEREKASKSTPLWSYIDSKAQHHAALHRALKVAQVMLKQQYA